MSAKTETTENKLRRWLEHKVILIKVVGNIKTSLKIISENLSLVKLLRIDQKWSQIMKWY